MAGPTASLERHPTASKNEICSTVILLNILITYESIPSYKYILTENSNIMQTLVPERIPKFTLISPLNHASDVTLGCFWHFTSRKSYMGAPKIGGEKRLHSTNLAPTVQNRLTQSE